MRRVEWIISQGYTDERTHEAFVAAKSLLA
jgi:hypothetical protein